MEFALYELNRYTALMGFAVDVKLSVEPAAFDMSRFFMADERYDDAFEINITSRKGYIKGTNERAVLIGVYHYIKRQGCRFFRPGKDGELIPKRSTPIDVTEAVYAKTRHRGTTNMDSWSLDGGVDTVLEYIDWLPKMAMNSFFIELEDYYDGIRCKYKNGTPCRASAELSYEDYELGHSRTLKELKKRHILYHNAGHGWTIRMMKGIDRISFAEDTTPCLNPEILAVTGGVRQIFNKKPIWTNLCYSQEKVRRDMAELVWEYSENHPETDFIHVWLADRYGNFCECDECRKKRPSDWYIMLLNEIDRLFTEKGSDKKIVFLIYFELAYPPLYERINNPDRFVMMFAPFGRDFEKSYRASVPADYTPCLNNDFSRDCMKMDVYLRQLEEWKKIFKGDSFSFDYVFYELPYFENICHVNYAKTPYLDCVDIEKYGLNGKIECGFCRAMTPTALTFYICFSELFYGDTDFNEMYRDYFEACYGKNQRVSSLLERIADLIPDDFIHRRKSTLTEAERQSVERACVEVDSFIESLPSCSPDEECQRRNYRCFEEFLYTLRYYLGIIIEKANGADEAQLSKMLAEYKTLLYKAEAVMPGYLPAEATYDRLLLPIMNKN